MPRKKPSHPRRTNITYLSARGKLSNRPADATPQTAGSSRTAPPSSFGTIYFERNSAIPRSEDVAVLRRHARHLLKSPRSRLIVRGYSNRRSGDSKARLLARSRATVIRMLLQAMGVKERQIDTEVGDTYRVAADSSRASRAKNRRAELSTRAWDVGVSIAPSLLQNLRRSPRLRPRVH